MIDITIPMVPPSLNTILRMHHGAYRDLRRKMAKEVHWALLEARHMQPIPLPFAKITLTCHRARLLDADNNIGSLKPMLDVLRPVSKSNPNGLGLIEDDDASHCVVTYQQAKAKRGQECTVIVIERGDA